MDPLVTPYDEIERLQKENAALRKRMERLERVREAAKVFADHANHMRMSDIRTSLKELIEALREVGEE